MSRNGSGGYTLPVNSWNPAVNGVSATPADWQALIDDVAAAIQASVAADGQTPMTGNLQMGGYRLTGAGAPSGAGMLLRWEQLIRGADIPSAATITIPLEGQLFAITGSTAITAINATIAGRLVYLKFDAGIVLTHSANLLMPSGVNVTTGADDIAVFVSVSAGVWLCVSYPRFEAADYPSATGPTITWPYMTWADTGNMLLKRRNAAGTAWVVERGLFDSPSAQNVLSLNGGQLAGFRNKIINGTFAIRQITPASSGTVTLSAGQYGHDRWKAGSGGCSYAFSTTNNVVTLNITAGTLMQVIEGINLQSGTHTLGWNGTAPARIDGGAWGASGMTGTAVGGVNQTIEFGVGTLSLVQYEPGEYRTPFEQRFFQTEEMLCQRYNPIIRATSAASPLGMGMSMSGSVVTGILQLPVKPRVAPTGLTVSSNSHITCTFAGGSVSPTTVGLTAAGDGLAQWLALSGFTGLGTAQPCYVYLNTPTAYLQFTGCEL